MEEFTTLNDRKLAKERAEMAGAPESSEAQAEEEPEFTESDCMDLITTDVEPAPEGPRKEAELEKSKLTELKRLFRKIAEMTHPDKLAASGISAGEISRLEKIFKRALKAYNDNNWYVIYH